MDENSNSTLLNSVVFAKPDTLSLQLVKELQNNYCFTTIVDDETSLWLKLISDNKLQSVRVLSSNQVVEVGSTDFVLVTNNSFGLEKSDMAGREKIFSESLTLAQNHSAKLQIIIPRFGDKDFIRETNFLIKKLLDEYDKALFVATDLIANCLDTYVGSHLPMVIASIANSDINLKPVYSDDVAHRIIKNFFSFGDFGKTACIEGKEINKENVTRLVDINKSQVFSFSKVNCNLSIPTETNVDLVIENIKSKVTILIPPEVVNNEPTQKDEKASINEKLNSNTRNTSILFPIKFSEDQKVDLQKKERELVKPTVKTKDKTQAVNKQEYNSFGIKYKEQNTKYNQPSVSKKQKIVKVFWRGLAVLLIFIAVPLFLIIFSLSLLYFGISSNNLNVGYKLIDVGLSITEVNAKYTNYLSKIPVLGKLYESTYSYNIKLGKIEEVKKTNQAVEIESNKLFNTVLGKNNDDVVKISGVLSLQLDKLGREINYLQIETTNLNTFEEKTIGKFVETNKLEMQKNLAINLSDIARNIPKLFGVGKPAKYLLVNQNTFVPRPSGGIVDSFVVITLSGGKIVDKNYFTFSEIDKLLSGEIDAPASMAKYFGVKTWSSRDSNWYVDYNTVYSDLQWFINKSLDISADGVILITPDIYKSLIVDGIPTEASGQSVNLENFNEILSKDLVGNGDNTNLQQISEYLFNYLLTSEDNIFPFVKDSISSGIKNNNIRVFLNDPAIEQRIDNLGWSGINSDKDCVANCYSDRFGIYESVLFNGNLSGVSKSAVLDVAIEQGLVKRKLKLTIKNESKNIGYNSYIRIAAPSESGYDDVIVLSDKAKETRKVELVGEKGAKTAGVFVSLAPSQEKSYEFAWEGGASIDFSRSGSYLINLNKQTGIDLPLELSISLPEIVKYRLGDGPALTYKGISRYNTKLVSDETYKFHW